MPNLPQYMNKLRVYTRIQARIMPKPHICSACNSNNCLACDGGKCKCECALVLDRPHKHA